MAFFNYATMQMAAKVVYYGPGLCGKTTNLQYIYNKTAPRSRGEMVSLETESDRTLFFDLLPLEVGVIAGFRTRFQLYTVPGQVFYGETRRMVLKGVDGIVFVADSQIPVLDANLESLRDLEHNLAEMGLSLDHMPIVMQYNKRDLPNILPVDVLEKALNPKGWPSVEASAIKGSGVFDTLKAISRLTLTQLTSKLVRSTDPGVRVVDSAPPVAQAQAPQLLRPQPADTPAPVQPAVPEIEFATQKTEQSDQELAQTAPKVRTVATASGRVATELDRIRESLLGPILAPQRPKVKDLGPALEDLKRLGASLLPETQIEAVLPANILRELASLEIRVRIRSTKGAFAETNVKVEAPRLSRSGDGWVFRLALSPKKS